MNLPDRHFLHDYLPAHRNEFGRVAHPAKPEQHDQRRRVVRATLAFAEACQRYAHDKSTRKPEPQALNPYYLSTRRLCRMAQALPFGVVMPDYFTAARWEFQFAVWSLYTPNLDQKPREVTRIIGDLRQSARTRWSELTSNQQASGEKSGKRQTPSQPAPALA